MLESGSSETSVRHHGTSRFSGHGRVRRAHPASPHTAPSGRAGSHSARSLRRARAQTPVSVTRQACGGCTGHPHPATRPAFQGRRGSGRIGCSLMRCLCAGRVWADPPPGRARLTSPGGDRRACVAPAPLAWRGARRRGDPRGRYGDGRQPDAHGRRARYRPDHRL